MHSSARLPRAGRLAFAVIAVWLVAYELHVTIAPSWLAGSLFGSVAQVAVLFTIAGLCLLRAAAVRAERWAWLLIGLGLLAWALGDAYYDLALARGDSIGVPSLADVGYLGFIPALFAGLALLVRERLPSAPRTLWVDGVTAALAAAAASAAVVFQAVNDTVGGKPLEVATNLAYPVGDLVLIGMVVAVIALNGWRPGRAWLLLGAGMVIFLVADSLYLVQTARGTYSPDSPFDAGWWAGMLLIARAAWVPAQDAVRARRRAEGMSTILFPLVFAVVGLALLVDSSFHTFNILAVGLAAASLLAVMVRLVMSFDNNLALLKGSRHEALTDALTGLGNRRKLVSDLQAAFEVPQRPDEMRMLALFDLDGFKHYNDTFGHLAGDSLLARLGGNLGAAIEPYGCAYRMGGDEFCALVAGGAPGADAVLASAVAALSDRGELFEITTSFGAVLFPSEADTPEVALRLADDRMYTQKNGRQGSARQQTRDVLLGLLREREPALHDHLADVGAFAFEVGRHVGLGAEEIDELTRAAELHDIGKAAIPDAILSKPGPLDDAEWGFIRRHTIIGERILAAAPALVPVAKIVRSSHECWDGTGYPDGLSGDAIPLGARIVAVCDAFQAMTSDRSYRRACSASEALAELRRCAGEQFDPAIVESFCRVLEGVAPPTPGPEDAAAGGPAHASARTLAQADGGRSS